MASEMLNNEQKNNKKNLFMPTNHPVRKCFHFQLDFDGKFQNSVKFKISVEYSSELYSLFET